MHTNGLNPTTALICLLVIALALVLPTSAVHSSQATVDTIREENAVVLAPAAGPNADYVTLDTAGNLTIDLSSPGLNIDAETIVKEVFVVANDGSEPVDVWFTHNHMERIRLQNESGGSIQGTAHKNRLSPGEETIVTIVADTHGSAPTEVLLDEIEINAEPVDADEPDGTEEDGGIIAQPSTPTPTSTPSPTPPATPTPTPPQTPPPTASSDTPPEEAAVPADDSVTFHNVPVIEIIFESPPAVGAGDSENRIAVRELTAAEFDELDTRIQRTSPRAVAEVEAIVNEDTLVGVDTDVDETVAISGSDSIRVLDKRVRVERTEEVNGRIRAAGADALTITNVETTISGTRSIIGKSQAITHDRKVLKAVDIQVPAEWRNKQARIRLWVERDRFVDSDPRDATVAHYTDDGWQILPTRIVSMDDNRVVFETRTTGFSPFAVFAENNAEYTWELAGETATGQEITTKFSAPGFYTATLDVTDSFGESDSATTRLLVNDPPDATVHTEGELVADENVTLTAEITNEVGDLEVIQWEFHDTTLHGESVTRQFDRGEHVVTLSLRDEYGAITELRVAITIGPASIVAQAAQMAPRLADLGSRMAVIAPIVIPLLVLARRFLATRDNRRQRTR